MSEPAPNPPGLDRLTSHAGYILRELQAGGWLEARRDYFVDSRHPISRRTYGATLVRSPNDPGHRIGGPTVADLLLYRYVEREARGEYVRLTITERGAKRLAQWLENGGGRYEKYFPRLDE